MQFRIKEIYTTILAFTLFIKRAKHGINIICTFTVSMTANKPQKCIKFACVLLSVIATECVLLSVCY